MWPSPPAHHPQYNIEAEQALLGAILVNNEAITRVAGLLSPQHFYGPLHQQIFETLSQADRRRANRPRRSRSDLFRDGRAHRRHDHGARVSGQASRQCDDHHQCARLRPHHPRPRDAPQLIVIGEDLVNTAYDSPVDFPPSDQIEEAETRLFSLAETGGNERAVMTAHGAIMAAIAQADAAQRNGTGLAGLATGIHDLDAKLGGLAPSDLVVVAGRPEMGKTALATTFGENIARAGDNVYVASLEMSATQIGGRLVAGAIGMSAFDLRRGIDVAERMAGLLDEAQRWTDVPLQIDKIRSAVDWPTIDARAAGTANGRSTSSSSTICSYSAAPPTAEKTVSRRSAR